MIVRPPVCHQQAPLSFCSTCCSHTTHDKPGHSGDEAIGTSIRERSQEIPPAAGDAAAVRLQRQGEEADNVTTASANNDDDDNDDDEGANIAAVDTVAGGETSSLQNVPEGIDGDVRREGVAAGLPVPGTRVPVLTADATVAGVRYVGVKNPSTLVEPEKMGGGNRCRDGRPGVFNRRV